MQNRFDVNALTPSMVGSSAKLDPNTKKRRIGRDAFNSIQNMLQAPYSEKVNSTQAEFAVNSHMRELSARFEREFVA